MKAKYFKKIRAELQPYEVVQSGNYTFGSSYFKCDILNVFARNPAEAVKRYCRAYRRKYKERCEHDDCSSSYFETNKTWMRFRVKDKRGYITYWK